MSARLDIIAPSLVDYLLLTPGDALSRRVARVLARGEMQPTPTTDVDAAILAWFGQASCAGVASLSAALDLPTQDHAQHWLRADPVHLRADATRVILFDADSVGLDAEDSDALLAQLNAGFADEALRFERGAAPTRWYVRTPTPAVLAMASPRSLRGTEVEDSLDHLRRAGAFNRYMTEAQMLLYTAPANEARVAQGRAPINSVWFWGGGAAPTLSADKRAAVLGDDDLLAACARHAGLAHHPRTDALADVLLATQGEVLLLEQIEAPSFNLSHFAEHVLAPACAALARGRLATLAIHTQRCSVMLERASRWKLWRRAEGFLDDARRLLDTDAQ